MRGLQTPTSVLGMTLRPLGASTSSRRQSFMSPSCSIGGSKSKSNTIKVVVNGAASDVGKAAIAAIQKARGMEVAGAVDTKFEGKDAGEVAGLDEALELPILNDLVMVLGSLSQGTSLGVYVDLSDPAGVYENIRQATAFGLKSVVGVPGLEMDTVAALSSFCEKASTGCIVAPSLSIGAVLLQQAAAAAAFQYKNVEILESQCNLAEYPSQQATQLASSISGLGQIFNEGSALMEYPARGAVVGDGVRIHSMASPGLVSSLDVRFSAPGELLSFRHDVTNVQALMPGLLLAIRRVVRLKSLVYGLEKIL